MRLRPMFLFTNYWPTRAKTTESGVKEFCSTLKNSQDGIYATSMHQLSLDTVLRKMHEPVKENRERKIPYLGRCMSLLRRTESGG
ncbi:hypothetical protein C0J52_26555 [Blattella germanica]|nr:hypothetical protein C0J52_26555 [Blattella germanica]